MNIYVHTRDKILVYIIGTNIKPQGYDNEMKRFQAYTTFNLLIVTACNNIVGSLFQFSKP